MVLLPVGMIGCITCSHKVVSPAFGDVNVASPNPDGIAPWYAHAYIQGYTVMQKYIYYILHTTYIYILYYICLMFLDNNTLTVVCLSGDIMLQMLHLGTSLCSLCKLRIRLVKLNRWVLQWPSQEFYFGVAWSFKNRQGLPGDRNQWTCDDLWVKCSFFHQFWGRKGFSKFCGIYSLPQLSWWVEHGPCTAQADRQRDPERLPLAKQELRGVQGWRMCRISSPL